MLYIQSLWSKPMLDSQLKLQKSGWFNKKAFYYGTILSALLLEKNNPRNSLLITDRYGKKLLVDKIGLNYNEVIVELDVLNDYNSGFWALGKIYSYNIMKEPFIHFDFDFFLASRLSKNIEESELCAYMPENSSDFLKFTYAPALKLILSVFTNLHDKFNFFNEMNYRFAYNAGIIGGKSLDIFEELKEIAFYIVEKNNASIETSNKLNIILEQYVFGCLAYEYKKEVVCLEETWPPDKFSTEQNVHLLGHIKRSPINCKEIEEVLLSEFPEYYEKINFLLQTNQI